MHRRTQSGRWHRAQQLHEKESDQQRRTALGLTAQSPSHIFALDPLYDLPLRPALQRRLLWAAAASSATTSDHRLQRNKHNSNTRNQQQRSSSGTIFQYPRSSSSAAAAQGQDLWTALDQRGATPQNDDLQFRALRSSNSNAYPSSRRIKGRLSWVRHRRCEAKAKTAIGSPLRKHRRAFVGELEGGEDDSSASEQDAIYHVEAGPSAPLQPQMKEHIPSSQDHPQSAYKPRASAMEPTKRRRRPRRTGQFRPATAAAAVGSRHAGQPRARLPAGPGFLPEYHHRRKRSAGRHLPTDNAGRTVRSDRRGQDMVALQGLVPSERSVQAFVQQLKRGFHSIGMARFKANTQIEYRGRALPIELKHEEGGVSTATAGGTGADTHGTRPKSNRRRRRLTGTTGKAPTGAAATDRQMRDTSVERKAVPPKVAVVQAVDGGPKMQQVTAKPKDCQGRGGGGRDHVSKHASVCLKSDKSLQCPFSRYGCPHITVVQVLPSGDRVGDDLLKLAEDDMEAHAAVCSWGECECDRCGVTISREHLTIHMRESCALRLITCSQCGAPSPAHEFSEVHRVCLERVSEAGPDSTRIVAASVDHLMSLRALFARQQQQEDQSGDESDDVLTALCSRCDTSIPVYQFVAHLRSDVSGGCPGIGGDENAVLACPFGCSRSDLSLATLSIHMAHCPQRVVPCRQCAHYVPFVHVTEHLRTECLQRTRTCPVCHDDSVLDANMEWHRLYECPSREIMCRLCRAIMPASTTMEHALRACRWRPRSCPNVDCCHHITDMDAFLLNCLGEFNLDFSEDEENDNSSSFEGEDDDFEIDGLEAGDLGGDHTPPIVSRWWDFCEAVLLRGIGVLERCRHRHDAACGNSDHGEKSMALPAPFLRKHLVDCVHNPVECQQCGTIVTYDSLAFHRDHSCRFRLVECEFSGCTVKPMPFCELKEHMSVCPFGRPVCIHCGGVIGEGEHPTEEAKCPIRLQLVPCRNANCRLLFPAYSIDIHQSECCDYDVLCNVRDTSRIIRAEVNGSQGALYDALIMYHDEDSERTDLELLKNINPEAARDLEIFQSRHREMRARGADEVEKYEDTILAESLRQDTEARRPVSAKSAGDTSSIGCGMAVPFLDLARHHAICSHREVLCIECGQRIRFIDRIRHADTACPARLEPCPDCEVLVRKSDVTEHKELLCERRMVACEWCNERMPRDMVGVHHRTDCIKRPYECELCGDQLAHFRDLPFHRRNDCAEEISDCPHCGKPAMNRPELEYHVEHLCVMRKVMCRRCGEPGIVVGQMGSHRKFHCDARPGVCDLCGRYMMEGRIRNHRENACPERMCKCRHDGCKCRMKAKEEVVHARSCRHRPVACAKCGESVPFHRLRHHVHKLCKFRVIWCTHGCKQKVVFNQMKTHVPFCPKRPVKCSRCGTTVPFDGMHDHRVRECLRSVEERAVYAKLAMFDGGDDDEDGDDKTLTSRKEAGTEVTRPISASVPSAASTKDAAADAITKLPIPTSEDIPDVSLFKFGDDDEGMNQKKTLSAPPPVSAAGVAAELSQQSVKPILSILLGEAGKHLFKANAQLTDGDDEIVKVKRRKKAVLKARGNVRDKKGRVALTKRSIRSMVRAAGGVDRAVYLLRDFISIRKKFDSVDQLVRTMREANAGTWNREVDSLSAILAFLRTSAGVSVLSAPDATVFKEMDGRGHQRDEPRFRSHDRRPYPVTVRDMRSFVAASGSVPRTLKFMREFQMAGRAFDSPKALAFGLYHANMAANATESGVIKGGKMKSSRARMRYVLLRYLFGRDSPCMLMKPPLNKDEQDEVELLKKEHPRKSKTVKPVPVDKLNDRAEASRMRQVLVTNGLLDSVLDAAGSEEESMRILRMFNARGQKKRPYFRSLQSLRAAVERQVLREHEAADLEKALIAEKLGGADSKKARAYFAAKKGLHVAAELLSKAREVTVLTGMVEPSDKQFMEAVASGKDDLHEEHEIERARQAAKVRRKKLRRAQRKRELAKTKKLAQEKERNGGGVRSWRVKGRDQRSWPR